MYGVEPVESAVLNGGQCGYYASSILYSYIEKVSDFQAKVSPVSKKFKPLTIWDSMSWKTNPKILELY